jgi:hypothetical protein
LVENAIGRSVCLGGLLNAVRQVGATLMGAVVAVGAGWALLLSATVCVAALSVFACFGRRGAASND